MIGFLRRLSYKSIAIFLSMLFILYIFPFQSVLPAIAADNTLISIEAGENEVGESVASEIIPYLLGEELELRESDLKCFRRSDGALTAVRYGQPVHYYSEGKWEEIDNSLVLNTDSSIYETASPRFQTSFPVNLHKDSSVSFSNGDYYIRFCLEGQQETEAIIEQPLKNDLSLVQQLQKELYDKNQSLFVTASAEKREEIKAGLVEKASKLEKQMIDLPQISSKITYPNTLPAVDLVYELSGTNLKEKLLINEYSENTYCFYLSPNGLKAELREDKSVVFFAEDELVFVIPAPIMWDNNEASSNEIEVVLTETNDGYQYTLKPNDEWLKSEDRAYPVTLDPTFVTANGGSVRQLRYLLGVYELDYYQYSTNSYPIANAYNQYANTYNQLKVGRYSAYGFDFRSAFSVSTAFPENVSLASRLVEARLLLDYKMTNTATCAPDLQVNAYICEENLPDPNEIQNNNYVDYVYRDWDDYLDESLLLSSPEEPENPVLDYSIINDSGMNSANTRVEFDLTLALQDRADWRPDTSNIAVTIYTPDDLEDDQQAKFHSIFFVDGGTPPTFVFTYRDAKGIEEYWTYTTMDVNANTTIAVNNFTRNGVIAHNELSSNGNRAPVSISRVFNTALATSEDYCDYGMGYGWQTNYHQFIRMKTISDQDVYYWTDGDATDHYFYEASDGCLLDEDGLGLELVIQNQATGNYTLKPHAAVTNTSTLVFTGGQLSSIQDSSGNTVQITHDANGKITQIKDGLSRLFMFSYALDGTLSSIIDPNGKQVQYEYSAVTGNTKTRIISAKYYNNSNTLYKEVEYQYFDTDLPNNFKYSILNIPRLIIDHSSETAVQINLDDWPTLGICRLEKFEYANGQTQDSLDFLKICLECEQASVYTKQGEVYVYRFNHYGQTVYIYESRSKVMQSYEFGAPGGISAQNGTANKLLRSSAPISFVSSFIQNGSFSNNLNEYTVSHNAAITIDSSYGNKQNGSAKIAKAANATGCYSLIKRADWFGFDSTISAYLSTNGEALTGPGAVMTIKAYDANNAVIRIQQTAPVVFTDANEWKRVFLTLKASDISTASHLIISFDLPEGTSGTLWVDDIQAEDGDVANNYNMIQDASGEVTGWHDLNPSIYPYGYWTWTGSGTGINEAGYCDYGYTQSVNIRSNSFGNALVQRCGQTLNGAKPSNKTDVFVFGGMAKAFSVPTQAKSLGNSDSWQFKNTIPTFRICVMFIKNNQAVRTEYCDFDYRFYSWHYASKTILVPEDYDSIEYHVEYSGNNDVASFSGLFLYKENYAQSYTYNENGQVVSSQSLSQAQASFAYQNANLAKAANPTGTKFFYTYDDDNNLVLATTTNGQRYEFQYDTFGNPTEADIRPETYALEPVYEEEYILRNSATGRVLLHTSDGIKTGQYVLSGDESDQLWLISNPTPAVLPGEFTIQSGRQAILHRANDALSYGLQVAGGGYSLGGNASVFTLYPNGDGSVRIVSPSGISALADVVENDLLQVPEECEIESILADRQRWYLVKPPEVNAEEAFISSSMDYSEDGNYLQRVLDEAGNATTYEYENDLLKKTTNANGIVTQNTYDGWDRLTRVTLQNKVNQQLAAVDYAYDSADRLTQIKAGNTKYNLFYNSLGQTTKTTVSGTGNISHTLSEISYNEKNLPVSLLYGNGAEKKYDYTEIAYGLSGRTDSHLKGVYFEENGARLGEFYSYDSNGSVAVVKDTMANQTEYYQKDISGRAAEVYRVQGTENSSTDILTQAKYKFEDGTDRLLGAAYSMPRQNANSYHTIENGFSYSALSTGKDQLTASTVKTPNQTTLFAYSYDKLGRLSQQTNSAIGSTQSYQYASAVDYDNPQFYTVFDSSLSSNQGDFRQDSENIFGVLTNDFSHSITCENGEAVFYNFTEPSNLVSGSYNYHHLISPAPANTLWQIEKNGITVELNLKLEALTELTASDHVKSGQTGFITNVRLASENKEFYFGIAKDTQGANNILITSYEGDRNYLDGCSMNQLRTNLVIGSNAPYYQFRFLYDKYQDLISLWINGEYIGDLGSPTTRSLVAGYYYQDLVHFSAVNRDINLENGIAETKVRLQSCKIYNFALPDAENRTTTLVSNVQETYSVNGTPTTFSQDVSYDALGNVTELVQHLPTGETYQYSYQYDKKGQMTYSTLLVGNKTWRDNYTYSNYGNITKRSSYYTFNNQTTSSIKNYRYQDTSWPDLLTTYDNQSFTYDEIGNPLTYRGGLSMTWKYGRRLASINNGNNVLVQYSYDASGNRIQKTTGGVTTVYYMIDGIYIGENRSDGKTLLYLRDGTGRIIGVSYQKNAQSGFVDYYFTYDVLGNIVAIRTSSGLVATYTYNPYGAAFKNLDIVKQYSDPDDFANVNPFRYKGYYFDTETGFYYLSSRYYDPELGRFLNPDSFVSTGQGVLGNNMFAYCLNNPVSMCDLTGEFAVSATVGAAALLKLGLLALGLIGALIFTTAIVNNHSDLPSISVPKTTTIKPKAETKTKVKDITTPNIKEPPKDHVHHIVAKADPRAKESRQILMDVGIDPMTDPLNLVALPQNYHVSLHTTAYHNYVIERLKPVVGNRAGVENVLKSLKAELLLYSESGIRWE